MTVNVALASPRFAEWDGLIGPEEIPKGALLDAPDSQAVVNPCDAGALMVASQGCRERVVPGVRANQSSVGIRQRAER